MTTSPRDHFIDEISRVNRKLRTLFDARVKERGLTLSRARVLLLLSRRDVLNQRDLAEELDIETPTLVRLLDGMQKQDFVERRVMKGDRRANQVVLTAHGRTMAAEVNRLARDLRAELMSSIDERQIESALGVLAAVGENISLACGKGSHC
ncbi:MAG: MarR family winged helix-turn-helix transcriptional regulator [Shinella sp.]|nr:MarR family winged helix-turn-helix transcriptional regulator [Shinella sp.]